MGAGPSLRSPLATLKERESEIDCPGIEGISDERSPVVSSHALGDKEDVCDVVTGTLSDPELYAKEDSPYHRILGGY